MKKKLLLVFLLAFAACSSWNLIADFISGPDTGGRTERSAPASFISSWLTPLKPLEEKAYVYLHFEEAMDAKMARIPMYVSINIVPQSLRQAVIATEDRRFYSHGAIDPIGIIRAAAVNLYSGETVEGGSTISQQVVKNVFLSHERTLSRKVQEVILAFLLEHYYSKDDILEIYLNTAYFGANATGLYEACRTYYGIGPDELRLSQSSMLAGLLQAPTYYNPLEHYDAARKRQQVVLALMAEQGYISASQATQAYRDDLGLSGDCSETN
ncbi:transglycosylase [Megasphaera sp. ASD88]|uniref:transglycosylase domain-containing protein n=1 Tax=Megasphaera sp. ASD88 TaxID=2027407 RepID=UPI000BABC2D2|nr:biosynthetic peptidoglycan transglycosylase [Megasphaera sp. ASD88]PAV39464.1 transglycosylase [Megasphaera sp. ASD88]